MSLKALTDPRSPRWRRRPLLFLRSLSPGGGFHLTPEVAQLLLLLGREPCSLAGVDLVLVYPVPKGAIGDTDLTGDLGDGMLLIGGSNQPDSFSAKLRWVGQVCSWQCSPFRALFSVLNSPRNRRKSTVPSRCFQR